MYYHFKVKNRGIYNARTSSYLVRTVLKAITRLADIAYMHKLW